MTAAQAVANVWPVSDIQQKRRDRLAAWLERNGGAAAVSRRLHLSVSTGSHISQVIGGHSFGERAARNMEEKLGMPPRYLDQDYTDTDLEKLLVHYYRLSPEARIRAQAYVEGLADSESASRAGNREAA